MPAVRQPAPLAPARRQGGERGAAVVEFTLVSLLLVGLFLAVLQVGLIIHVRNTLVACAAEGARYAANADRTLADGERRALQLAAASISAGLLDGVRARHVTDVRYPGVTLVEVEMRAALPLVGLLGPSDGLVVTGHAVEEAP